VIQTTIHTDTLRNPKQTNNIYTMNETNDFLDLGIGSETRLAKVVDVTKQEVQVPARGTVSDKLVLTVTNGNDRQFKISDAWVEDHKGAQKIQGLWLTKTKSKDGQMELAPQSAVAKLLHYYDAKSPREMINKEVIVHPDPSNFLVIAACDITEIPEEEFESDKTTE